MNSKNIDKLIEEAWAIEREDARSAGALGFTARALAIATMPHRKTDEHVFKRRNGEFCLTMLSDPEIGLPYGSIPRLLIAWLTTEVQRTKERRLILGPSLGSFMKDLGLTPSAGRWGTKIRCREQMNRLFSCYIRSSWDGSRGDLAWSRVRNRVIADDYELWWDPRNENQSALWQSWVELGEKFFLELRDHPVPIDLRAINKLKRSPLALDIYTWLTHRVSYLRKETSIPWAGLQMQFGSGYAMDAHGQRDFRRAFLRELKKVLLVYSAPKLDASSECLTLHPSRSHILPSRS